MKESDRASTFQVTLVDVVFGILLGALFTKYELAHGFSAHYLFFFTAALLINYWYTYRRWCDSIVIATERSLLADVIFDMLLLFVGYQLALNFHKDDLAPYVTWFVIAFLADLGWLIERIILHRKRASFDQRHVYWLITDGIVFLLLLPIYMFLRKSSFPHSWVIITVTITFLATFALDPFVEATIGKRVRSQPMASADDGPAPRPQS